MTTFILIGGDIKKAPDGGKSFCEEIKKHANGTQIKILDCLFARPQDIWEEKSNNDIEFFSNHLENFDLVLAKPENFIEQLKVSNVIFFQGGFPQDLISTLNITGDWLKEIETKIVVGSSAGADIFCKYYGVGKTMNIREGLGILPIKFIPHWKSDYGQGLNIDWDTLLSNLQSYNEGLEVITLQEGEFKIIKQKVL